MQAKLCKKKKYNNNNVYAEIIFHNSKNKVGHTDIFRIMGRLPDKRT